MNDMADRLAAIDAAERALELASFTADDAWALGAYLRGTAAAIRAPVSILIQRSGGAVAFSASLEGATVDNNRWAQRKVAVALWFERSSLAVALDFQARNCTLADFALPYNEYAAAGGAVPLRVKGAGCVAAIAMSGLASAEDHDLVMAAITWLQREQKS